MSMKPAVSGLVRPRATSTRKYLAETSRKRFSPLLGAALAAAALFGAYLAWVFLADHRTPRERWDQEVEPRLHRARQRADQRDWPAALRACDEAIRAAEGECPDFTSRIQDLKALRRQVLESRQREREADLLAGEFGRFVAEFKAAAFPGPEARCRRARELARDGEECLRRVAGTPAEASVKAGLDYLNAVPAPVDRPTWLDCRRRVDDAIRRQEFAEALVLIAAFASSSPESERRGAEAYREIVEVRAREYYRRRYPPERTPEERIREEGRGPLREKIREDLRRLKGMPEERDLKALASRVEP